MDQPVVSPAPPSPAAAARAAVEEASQEARAPSAPDTSPPAPAPAAPEHKSIERVRPRKPISAVWPGQPYPRGATWDGEGVNFSIFSGNAAKVELCLFDSTGRREVQRIELRERTDDSWHGYLPEGRPGMLYGYRVHGPYDPARGHRFNPNKLLIEPYAKHIQGELKWSDAHFGYRVGHAKEDLSFDKHDNAAGMPKCRVIDPAFTWGDDRPPRTCSS